MAIRMGYRQLWYTVDLEPVASIIMREQLSMAK
jgi:hypothetical protein